MGGLYRWVGEEMKTKWFPPRKTPDLHSEKDFLRICEKLGISDLEIQADFKECVEEASATYLESRVRNQNRFTEKQEENELERLASYLKKSRDIYRKISNESQMGIFRFLEGFKNANTKYDKEKRAISALSHNGIFINSSAIEGILDVLYMSAREAINSDYIFSKSNKTDLVLQWLWEFSDEWQECSDVTISEGRYDETLMKYDSPAMRILDVLAEPLCISNSKIAEAIKAYRENKKTEIPFDPREYSQE